MGLCTATFEAGTHGNNVAAADPGSVTPWDSVSIDANATDKYDNTQAHNSTLACKITTVTGSPCRVLNSWSTAFGTQTDHYGRFYIRIGAFGGFFIGAVFFGAGFTTSLYVNASGAIILRDEGGVTRATSSNFLAVNVWNRIEYHFIHSATVGQIEAKLFLGANADGATPDETVATAANLNTGANQTQINFGQDSNDVTWTYWLDDIVAGATSYPGPTVGPVVAWITA